MLSANKKIYLLFFVLIIVVSICSNDVLANDLTDCTPFNSELLPDVRNLIGFEIGKNRLDDISNKYSTPIFITKDKEGTTKNVCLIFIKNKSEIYCVRFGSAATGGWDYITEYSIRKIKNNSQCKQCAVINEKELQIDETLIDKSLEEVRLKLGEPSKHSLNSIKYCYEYERKMTSLEIEMYKKNFQNVDDYPYLGIYSVVELFLDNGVVTSYAVYETETY